MRHSINNEKHECTRRIHTSKVNSVQMDFFQSPKGKKVGSGPAPGTLPNAAKATTPFEWRGRTRNQTNVGATPAHQMDRADPTCPLQNFAHPEENLVVQEEVKILRFLRPHFRV